MGSVPYVNKKSSAHHPSLAFSSAAGISLCSRTAWVRLLGNHYRAAMSCLLRRRCGGGLSFVLRLDWTLAWRGLHSRSISVAACRGQSALTGSIAQSWLLGETCMREQKSLMRLLLPAQIFYFECVCLSMLLNLAT